MSSALKVLSMLIVSFLLAAQTVQAQSLELTCRAKAKEIAIETYSACVSEGRKAKLSEIKANYKSELAQVKAKYDQMLKELAPQNTGASAASKKASVTNKGSASKAERPTSGVARTLPAKQHDNGPALPMNTTDTQSTPVVAEEPTSVITANPQTDGSGNTGEPEMVETISQ